MWDLRKNEPIIQVADSSSRVRCSAIAWHPDVATQMVTASGDDRAPIIQVGGAGCVVLVDVHINIIIVLVVVHVLDDVV